VRSAVTRSTVAVYKKPDETHAESMPAPPLRLRLARCVSVCVHARTPMLACTAVLSFYNAQLQDVINYGDMRTEMFQHLRELGNCILFSMLLEQAMVSVRACRHKNLTRAYFAEPRGGHRSHARGTVSKCHSAAVCTR
jgi:hypothetical protein